MRIAFFGLPLAACLLQADGHRLVYAGISRVDAPGRRRLRRHLGDDAVVLRPDVGSPDLVRRIAGLAPDLLVSWFWTTRLPIALVRAARLGGIEPLIDRLTLLIQAGLASKLDPLAYLHRVFTTPTASSATTEQAEAVDR